MLFINLFVCGCGSAVPASDEKEKYPMLKKVRNQSSKDYNKLLTRVKTAGSIRVIVELNMPFKPDSQLSVEEANDQQSRISRMQDQLCAELSKYNVKGIKKFKYTPYMALMVDSTALRVLISNPLVLSLEEDIPVPPTKQ